MTTKPESLSARMRHDVARIGTLFVLATQTEDVEIREAARFTGDEIDFRHGPQFVPLRDLLDRYEAAVKALRQAERRLTAILNNSSRKERDDEARFDVDVSTARAALADYEKE